MLMSNDKRVLQVLDLLEQSRVFKAGEIAALQEYLAENADRRILEEIGKSEAPATWEELEEDIKLATEKGSAGISTRLDG